MNPTYPPHIAAILADKTPRPRRRPSKDEPTKSEQIKNLSRLLGRKLLQKKAR